MDFGDQNIFPPDEGKELEPSSRESIDEVDLDKLARDLGRSTRKIKKDMTVRQKALKKRMREIRIKERNDAIGEERTRLIRVKKDLARKSQSRFIPRSVRERVALEEALNTFIPIAPKPRLVRKRNPIIIDPLPRFDDERFQVSDDETQSRALGSRLRLDVIPEEDEDDDDMKGRVHLEHFPFTDEENDFFIVLKSALAGIANRGYTEGVAQFTIGNEVRFKIRVRRPETSSTFEMFSVKPGIMEMESHEINIESFFKYMSVLYDMNDSIPMFGPSRIEIPSRVAFLQTPGDGIERTISIRFWNPKFIVSRGLKKVKLEGKKGFAKLHLGMNHKYDPGYPCLFSCFFILTHRGRETIATRWIRASNTIKEICKRGKLEPFLEHLREEFQITLPVYMPDFFHLDDRNPSSDKILILNKEHAGIVSRAKMLEHLKKKDKKAITDAVYVLKAAKPSFHIPYKDFEYFIDIETYSDKGFQIPYLICVYSSLGVQSYWGEQCIEDFKQFTCELKKDKGSNYIFWAFNGGKFDYVLLIKHLISAKTKILGTPTTFKQIICGNLYFNDLLLLLPVGSLRDQCALWGVSVSKLDFDIKNKDRAYFEEHKNSIIEYCTRDTICVSEILRAFKSMIRETYPDIDYDAKRWITLPGITLKIFNQYLGEDLTGTTGNVYYNEKSSYYGGVCYHVRKTVDKAYYYDINSSYPAAMLHSMPYKYESTVVYCGQTLVKTDLYYCSFEYNDDTICCMTPQHSKDGLVYSLVIGEGWRWGVELLFLQERAKIKNLVIKVVQQYTPRKVFANFINDLSIKKASAPTPQYRLLYKLLMNSLYGKFGQRRFNNSLILDHATLGLFMSTLDTYKNISSIDLLSKDGDQEIYSIELENEHQSFNFIGSLVRLSSYIAALSRINLFTVVYDVGDENICYMDTDSVFSTVEIPQHFIHQSDLGKWKLEQVVSNCHFWGPKMYSYDGESHAPGVGLCPTVKVKGVSNPQDLDIEQLETTGSTVSVSNKMFFRFFGAVLVEERQKLIRLMHSRRDWIGSRSRPRRITS